MRSVSFEKYNMLLGHAVVLRRYHSSMCGFGRKDREVFLHASLAKNVAAWDAYINSVVLEFHSSISKPVDPSFTALSLVAVGCVEYNLKKFNTPNWENTRGLIITCTGYDPVSDWVWARAGMGSHQVRMFLNEILKVRHSFAHGFSMPKYSWLTSARGNARLTCKSLDRVSSFLQHLVRQTDIGLSKHVASTYGVQPW